MAPASLEPAPRPRRSQAQGQTITTVTKEEADPLAFVETIFAPASEGHAERSWPQELIARQVQNTRTSHQRAYSWDGACTKQA